MTPCDVQTAAAQVLAAGAIEAKTAAARECAQAWRAGRISAPDAHTPSNAAARAGLRPARPSRPQLKPPGQVPRRRLGTAPGRFALLHAVAHIEFNAIDLAFDLVMRFAHDPRIGEDQRAAFISDWITVGEDEARHFELVRARLQAMGGEYGDLPAHDGLWSAAEATSGDLAARLAVAPMVLEARGLDVTPGMIERLRSVGDTQGADVLEIIYREEVAHVAAGRRWFEAVCTAEGHDPKARFQALVAAYFNGELKRPFNEDARAAAGLPADWYAPLAAPEA